LGESYLFTIRRCNKRDPWIKETKWSIKFRVRKGKNIAPEGTEKLSQGKDNIELEFRFDAHGKDWQVSPTTQYFNSKVGCSWNEIFSAISPLMIDEASEVAIKGKLNDLILKKHFDDLSKKFEMGSRTPRDFKLDDNNFQTLKYSLEHSD